MNKSVVAIGLVILAFVLLSNKASAADSASSNFDFTDLVNIYGEDKVNRLKNLYTAIVNSGLDLSDFQIQILLAQALHESGLFTDAVNLNNIDQLNNWAGIKSGSYGKSRNGGTYAYYSSLTDFVNNWYQLLSDDGAMDATSVSGFTAALKDAHYFTDSLSNYTRDVQHWYNVLNNVSLN